ncbi:MAG: ATP-dependent helicase [Candidatus Vogelbacteria bacterium]|nr:ATP-dependent helicase [Candidatus Vogelbacteria bacterium]
MLINDSEFQKLYELLNTEQKLAVDTIEGPVMVVAGPGTGKTQILTLRIANILRLTDTAPEQILALTFTEAGVMTMRKRLVSIMGSSAYNVSIYTFHGFCNEVISKFSIHFRDLIGSRPASELDQINILKKIFDSEEFEYLSTSRSPYHYVQSVRHTISLLKREDVSPSALRALAQNELEEIKRAPDYLHEKGTHKGKVKASYSKREEELAKIIELSQVYEKYEAELTLAKLFDFDDMILYVVRKLESDEKFRLIMQEEYQYVLADEHQDANGAQNKVLELLSSYHSSPNIFIVGDSKQAIYRFQGASVKNFEYVKGTFTEVKEIALTNNYRSTQTILDASIRFLSLGTEKRAELKSLGKHSEAKILVTDYVSREVEAHRIALGIKKLIEQGVPEHEIAIFTRTNRELQIYSDALRRENVPVSTMTKSDALDDPLIEKLLTIVKVIASVGDDQALVRALHLDLWDIPELDIYVLVREATKKHVSIWGYARNLVDTRCPPSSVDGGIKGIVTRLEAWAKLGQNVVPAVLVSKIAEESGIVKRALGSPESEFTLKKLSRFLTYLEEYTRANRSARIGDLKNILESLDEFNILEVKNEKPKDGKVQCMTAHKSKGLEFDHVFIVGAVEGNWSGGRSKRDFKVPGFVSVSKEDEEADDRRLFFVVLTRARKQAHISLYAKKGDSECLPSRFVEEIPGEFVIRESVADELTNSDLASLILPLKPQAQSFEDIKNFVRATFIERGLAVTGLNNYLSCPWKYFYRTLLRVPEPQTVPLMFGNAMHRTLKAYFDKYALNENMNTDEVIQILEHEIRQEYFSEKELKACLREGTEALTGYLKTYNDSWNRNLVTEYAVSADLKVGEDIIRLNGKLDKVEYIDVCNVNVVDYKTGKPKSRNHIEGMTKSDGAGEYKRQLVYYKLLLSKTENGLNMKSGTIDFVMPNKSGKYQREEFLIEDTEVEALEKQVLEVCNEILTSAFWDKTCGESDCEYCSLRKAIHY